jgi:NitT/TauT family transport system substrate-binding protein
MFRRAFVAGMAGASACLLGSCSRSGRSLSSAAKVRVSARPHLYMAPFFLASESGYFTRAGLDLELKSVEDGYQTIALLAGGELDVAFTSLTGSLINSVARGAAVRVVAGKCRLVPDCSQSGTLYGRRSTFPQGLANLADLKRELRGKRITLNSKASIAEFYLDMLLEKIGLAAGDVQIVMARFSEALAAVMGGKADAFLAPEEFGAMPVSASGQLVRGLGMSEVIRGFQYSHILFGQRLLNSDPDIGARFLGAQLQGTRDFTKGKTPKFMSEFARSNGFDAERAQNACRDNEAPDGAIDFESIRLMADWSARKGYSAEPVSAERIVDTRFLDRLHKEGA